MASKQLKVVFAEKKKKKVRLVIAFRDKKKKKEGQVQSFLKKNSSRENSKATGAGEGEVARFTSDKNEKGGRGKADACPHLDWGEKGGILSHSTPLGPTFEGGKRSCAPHSRRNW